MKASLTCHICNRIVTMETCKLLRSTHPIYSTSPLKMAMLSCCRHWPWWRQAQHRRDRGHWRAVYSQEEKVCQGGVARCCQVLSSEEKTIELFNHIVHHYFHAKWDIVFQGESRGQRKDCFEKQSQVQFRIEMFNLQNSVAKNRIWDVQKRWTVFKISSCESS